MDSFPEYPTIQSQTFLPLAWRFCLGLTALLDFLASVLPGLLRIDHTESDQQRAHKNPVLSLLLSRRQNISNATQGVASEEFAFWDTPLPDDSMSGSTLRWLDKTQSYFGLVFSIIWLVEAFFDASRARERALRKKDQQRLLQYSSSVQENDEHNDCDVDLSVLDELYFVGWGPWFDYYLALALQLLLLPIGFYVLVYDVLKLEAGYEESDLQHVIDTTFDTACANNYSIIDEDEEEQLQSFIANETNMALGIVLLRHGTVTLLHKFGLHVRKTAAGVVKRVVKGITYSAIKTPIKFRRRLIKTLTFLRWFKYLQPIWGATNKLKAHVKDLLKKFKQRREAILAQKYRNIMFQDLTESERRVHAARIIQSTYRSYKTRQSIRAMYILNGDKEVLAAIKLQSIFRGMLDRAHVRIEKKRHEFERLKRMQTLHRRAIDMTAEERKRMYELEEELQAETAKILNQRLLLRPNTKFAWRWKLLFVLCIVFEIAGLVWNPILKAHKDDDGNPLSVITVMEQALSPVPLSKLNECKCQQQSPSHNVDWITGRGIRAWKTLLQRKQQQITECKSTPWYCHPPFSTGRTAFGEFVRFMVRDFLVFVGFIVFLDVPVCFFTGEINEETGSLEPKPWFQRWILPGLVLQLLVNPQMKNTSRLVKSVMREIIDIGPVRVWRWFLALFYPLFMVTFDGLERVWFRLVRRENNQRSLLAQAKSSVFQKVEIAEGQTKLKML